MNDNASLAFQSQRIWGAVGAASAALAVVLGAFGAHGADEIMVEVHASAASKTIAGLEVPASYKYLEDFKTGAHYHLIHSIAIVLVGLLGRRGKARIIGHFAAGCFVMGILLFSGSLYLISTTGTLWPRHLAPIGGLLFIAGWILLGTAAAWPRTAHPDH